MNALNIILSIFLLISLLLDYLWSLQKGNSFDIVRKMGIGYNLANTFDSFSDFSDFETPDEQIEFNGNKAPNEDKIKKLKKYGFKTIRFPVTWMYFIDDEGNIKSEWMVRVKEVVDIIINEKLYCILNIHNDGFYDGWLERGMEVIDKYINLWTQIAREFKDYNEYLIFESMDKVFFYDYINYDFDYTTLTTFNQAFVDTIRNTGGNNIERLLIVAGANDEFQMTCTSDYKMPVDQSNKLAVSIHYLEPFNFIYNTYFEPYNWTDSNGFTYTEGPALKWGNSMEYQKVIEDFELMKSYFLDKGIPIIINKVGVLTEEKKEIESIREYLYMIFSISSNYEGITCCLWDTSNKLFGDMNFYDRINDIWYDEKIKNNFLQISKGKYIKPKDYYINTTFESYDALYSSADLLIDIENKKVLKIIINARITGVLFVDFDIEVRIYDMNNNVKKIYFGKENSKRQYDGTYIFTIDTSKIECNSLVEVIATRGPEYITFNNFTLEYEESFLSFDYKSFKNAIVNYIY